MPVPSDHSVPPGGAQVINLADEMARRTLLLALQDVIYARPRPGGARDAQVVDMLHALLTPQARRLADGSTRLALVLGRFLQVFDREHATAPAKIQALCEETEIDAHWLKRMLRASPRTVMALSS